MLRNNISSALVLEDDAVFDKSFVNEFNMNLYRTPKDWDFIFIGSGCDLRVENRKIQEGKVAYLRDHPASKCTDSYVISIDSARKVLDTINPFSFPIDFELNYQMALHNMNVYWWEPPLVRQGSQCGLYKSKIQQ